MSGADLDAKKNGLTARENGESVNPARGSAGFDMGRLGFLPAREALTGVDPTREACGPRAHYFWRNPYPLPTPNLSYTGERRTVRAGGRGVDSSGIEQLLESFATSALGIDLRSRLTDTHLSPASRQRMRTDVQGPTAWCAWGSASGPLTLLGRYDEVQSSLVKAHVLLLEWWIGDGVHHEGWWHCYPKFPRDWIKGPGRVNRW